jgi:hypothetical protein
MKSIWCACVCVCVHTVCGTLGRGPLATSTTHTNAVDDEALLGLVTQTAGLVGSGWAGCSVDDLELAILAKIDALSANVQRVTPKQYKRVPSRRVFQAGRIFNDSEAREKNPIWKTPGSLVRLGGCFTHFPASDTEQEAQHVGLLALLELFYVFEGTLCARCQPTNGSSRLINWKNIDHLMAS